MPTIKTTKNVILGMLATLTLMLAGTVPALAEPGTGQISGKISMPPGVANSDVFVSVYNSKMEIIHGEPVQTGKTYTLGDIPPGTYTVYVDYSGAKNVASAWYGGTYDPAKAKKIKVTAGKTSSEVNVALRKGATIKGSVYDGSTKTDYAMVYVHNQSGYVVRVATTDMTGNYVATGLPEGALKVLFTVPGSWSMTENWWNGKSSFKTANSISLSKTQTRTGVDGQVGTPQKVKSSTPKISGTAKVGKKLTAKPGSWTQGTTFKYQWFASGKAISGATKSTLLLTAAQQGKKITVKVTGSRYMYKSVSKTSKATAKVALGTLSTATPKISGTAKVGKKLTAKPGTWTKGTKLTYRWYAGGTAIKNATKSTYTLKKAQKGKTITVKVTGKKTGYKTITKTSKKTVKVS